MSYLRGDLPQALEAYADAGAQFDALGITSVDLVLDQATSYLAGGLADDALAVAEQALIARPLLARERADLLVSVAESALAARDWPRAASAADEGSALMRAQSRHAPSLEADLFAIAARTELGLPSGPLLRRAERLVLRMREASMPRARPGPAAGGAARRGTCARPAQLPWPTSGSRRRRPAAVPAPTPSARWAGSRWPSVATPLGTPAGCCGRATAVSAHSTSTRRPSAARNCAR